jgi:hypothetical protein
VAYRLACDGLYGGDPDKVLEAPVNRVLELLQYKAFLADYEAEEYYLNVEQKK